METLIISIILVLIVFRALKKVIAQKNKCNSCIDSNGCNKDGCKPIDIYRNYKKDNSI